MHKYDGLAKKILPHVAMGQNFVPLLKIPKPTQILQGQNRWVLISVLTHMARQAKDFSFAPRLKEGVPLPVDPSVLLAGGLGGCGGGEVKGIQKTSKR